jgi:hypothetical protein
MTAGEVRKAWLGSEGLQAAKTGTDVPEVVLAPAVVRHCPGKALELIWKLREQERGRVRAFEEAGLIDIEGELASPCPSAISMH